MNNLTERKLINKEKKLIIKKYPKEEVISKLKEDYDTWNIFMQMQDKYREELIEFCMGERGLRITYDPVFIKIMNPRKHPERLEDFLSSVLGEQVRIVEVIERQGVRITEDASFIIMDVLVILADGRYANVEMQKIGYKFPIERADCYTADIIMRQYNDLKKEQQRKFKFSNLSKVITIIIMEKSADEFKKDQKHAVHHRTSVFDTDIKADGLSENYFICLDTFKKFLHTKVKNKRDAWMLFFGSTDIKDIEEVCSTYPEFIELYEEVFDFKKETGELVKMYSEALKIMDKNTERYMVEELQEQLKEVKAEAKAEINAAKAETDVAKAEIAATKAEARRISDEKDKEIERLKKIIDEISKNRNTPEL